MKIDKQYIITLTKAANRKLELAEGRINNNRVFKNKKAYDRKNFKKVLVDC